MSGDCRDEQSLIEQARHDPDAFRELYRLYFPRVYAYVGYRVGNPHDVEDLVAETFLGVVRGLDRFSWRHDNSFAAWLFRIAHNLIGNYYRSTARAEQTLPLDSMPDVPSQDQTPEEVILREDLFGYLRIMIDDLSARRREVVLLRYYAGLGNQEIAHVLGLDERTVASHMSRALTDLLETYQSGEHTTGKTASTCD